ncbi:hypothetical protein [Saccharomonospora cyanea]
MPSRSVEHDWGSGVTGSGEGSSSVVSGGSVVSGSVVSGGSDVVVVVDVVVVLSVVGAVVVEVVLVGVPAVVVKKGSEVMAMAAGVVSPFRINPLVA